MKKIFFITLLILLLPVISAVEFTMDSEFAQGETLMAKLSGNFIDSPLEENVLLYRAHERVPLMVELAEIDEDYYIYAQLLGKNEGEYSLQVKSVRYMLGASMSEENLVKNFSITNITADFSINPGFVVTNKNFNIEVRNLHDHQITVEVVGDTNATEEEGGFFSFLFEDEEETTGRTVTLKSGEVEQIDFDITNITLTKLHAIELKTGNLMYEIPVYVFKEGKIPELEEKSFTFSPSVFPEISLATESESKRIVYLYNDGEETLENITLSVSELLEPYVNLSLYFIEELEFNKSQKITLSIFSDEEETIEGYVKAEADSLIAYVTVPLNFIKNYVPPEGEENYTVIDPAIDPAVLDTCEEMNGTICASNETCSEETQISKYGKCCLGTCEIEKKGSSKKVVGWLIVIAVVLFIAWFFTKKYKGAKRPFNLTKKTKGKK